MMFWGCGKLKNKIVNFSRYKQEKSYRLEMLEHLELLDTMLNDMSNVTLEDVQQWLDEAWSIYNENSTN